ncbi:hypothetical protein DCAR_0100651 [Daucus carota subsp. sativus]|uniref:YGGT family protein n=1 Tax=Daucus carota subsp. sativus TaxID=79200 RepID=A0AAF0W128_DAUCS|nr:PREDICTED: ylmG homolog protein 2, chloroplastic [Daucus carota subsp. sativus]WOG81502.1 hypothetical protein DCAR_0100651 [Daucus carota subsp. sativus]
METSTKDDSSHQDTAKCVSTHLVSNCLVVLPLTVPQFIHNPFVSPSSVSKQPFCAVKKLKIQSFVEETTAHVLDSFRDSVVCAANRCGKFLEMIASQNPFFGKVVSLSSDFQGFCQIHRRNYRSLNTLPNHNFAAILPGDSVAGLVAANGILNFLNIYNTLLVCRLVLTWFPNSPPVIVNPLSTLCDPYLNVFRGLIPPLGGTLDLSPILAFLVLNAFTSAATALPAELPSEGASPRAASSRSELFHLTSSQEKWAKRFAAKSAKSSSNDN